MSNETLRDRIAELLWRTEEKSWEGQAQAVIDEFGMTMETNAAVEGPRPMRRVIGEWEWA